MKRLGSGTKFTPKPAAWRIVTTLLVALAVIGSIFSSVIVAEGAETVTLVVKLVDGLTQNEQTAVIARDGGVEVSSITALRLHVITVTTDALSLVWQNYQSDAQVVGIEQDITRKAEAVPTDSQYGVQWAMSKIGWESVFGTVTPIGSATVALLDTGIDATHPDLAGSIIPGLSILDGSSGLSDPNGHGTFLAGVVAAVTDNGSGIAGIAYQGVKIMPVSVLGADGTGQDSNIIAGIVWAADHGANVILMGFSNPDFSQNLQDAVDYAWSKGAVLVAATGNDGLSTPTFPAGDRGVIGVSGTDEADFLVAGSNYGLDTFLAAPGANIYTTCPGDSYTYITGTSASSAVVAGVAGFMKAVDPTLANGVIVGRLAKSADAIGTADDPNNEMMFGNGRVNMANALSSTSTDSVQPTGAAPVGDGGPYIGPYVAAAACSKISFITQPQTLIVGQLSGIITIEAQRTNESPNYNKCTISNAAVTLSSSSSSKSFYSDPEGTTPITTVSFGGNGNTIHRASFYYRDMIAGSPNISAASCHLNSGSQTETTYNASSTVTVTGATTFTYNDTPQGPDSATVTGSTSAVSYSYVGTGSTSYIASATKPTATGTYNVTATVAADANYNGATSSAKAFTIGKNSSSVTVTGTTAFTYSGSPQGPDSASATGSTGAVTYSYVGTSSTTYTANASKPTAAGTYNVTATVAADANYNGATSSATPFTISMANSTVTITGTTAFTYTGTPQGPASATVTGSTGAVTYSYVGTGATTYTANASKPTATGSYNVTATVAADANHNGASSSATAFTIATASQTITFGALADKNLGAPTFTVSASASSALTVSFASQTTSVCTTSGVDGSDVAIVAIGTCTIRATQGGNGNYNTAPYVDQSFTVNPGPLHHFAISGGSPQTAGTPFSITIIAQDAGNNTVTGFTGTANLTTTAGTISPTATTAFDNGSWTGSVMVTGAGTGKTITAIKTDGSESGISNNFDVNPAAAVTFSVATSLASATAGSPFDLTVTAKDTYNNIATSYLGTIHFTSSDHHAGLTLPDDYTFHAGDNGSHSFANGVVLETAGLQTVTATDTASITGTSATIDITPATATVFSITAPSATTAGTPLSITVMAKDAYDNTDTNYTGTVTFTSTDGGATLPMPYTFMGGDYGTHIFTDGVTLITGGSRMVTATAGPITATSNSIQVVADSASKLAFISQASNATALQPITPMVQVAVQDQFGNVVTGNTDNVVMAIGTNPAGGSLSGTTTQAAVSGIASFNNLSVDNTGIGYTLAATSGSLAGATSNSFGIAAASQTITIGTHAHSSAAYGTSFPVAATASSGLDVAITSSGSCSGSGTNSATITMTSGSGICTVYYNQPGDASHDAAPQGSEPVSAQTAPLSITASNLTKTYGQILTFAGTEFTTSGLVGSDTVTNVTLTSAGAAASATVTGSPYAITTSTAVGTGLANYSITYNNGSLTVFIPLTPPATLTVPASNTTGSFTVSWGTSNVAGVTYVLEYSTDGGSSWTTAYSGTSTSTTVTVPTSGSYIFRVKATKTNYTDSAYATAASLTVNLICGAPASINVPASNTTGSFTVSWVASNVAGVTYVLEYSTDGGSSWTTAYSGTSTSTTVTVPTSGSYIFRVKATKTNYTGSAYATAASFTVNLICGAPASINVPASNTTGSFTVSWVASNVAGVTYVLEYSTDGGSSWTTAYSGTSTSTTVTVPTSGSYIFRVKATKTNYTGSAYATAASLTVNLICGAPASINVPASNTTGSFTVSWVASNVAGVTYVLEYSTDGGSSWTTAYSGTSTSTTVTVPTSGSYIFRVKATKTNYTGSAYATAASLTVNLICGAPASINVPASNTTGSFTVSWVASNVAGVTYVLEYSTDGGSSWTTAYSGTSTSTTVTVPTSGSYIFRVKATKTNYTGSAYATAASLTVNLICGAPASINVPASNTTGSFTVSWVASDVAGVTYVLEYSTDGGSSWTTAYSGTSTSTTVTVPTSGSYIFRVKATKTNYTGSAYATAASLTVNLICGAPASINVPASNTTGSFTVSWVASNVAGVTYVLEYSTDGGSSWTTAYSGTSTFPTVTVPTSGSYIFRVKATKTGYTGSAYATAASLTVNLICGAPASINVPASNTTGSFTVSWGASDVAGVTYVLEYSTDGGSSWTTAYIGTSTFPTVTVPTSGSYIFRVKATKTGYTGSAYATAASLTVNLICGAPASINVPASNTTGSFTVSWVASNVAGVTYVLEYSTDGGSSWTTAYSGTSTSPTVTVPTSGSYIFRVKATKTGYTGSAYATAASLTVNLICGAPASINVPASNTTGSFTVSWGASNVAGVTYVLEYSTDGGSSWTTAYIGTSTSRTVTVPTSGSYIFRVKATKTNYTGSAYVTAASFTVNLICGAPASINVPASNTTGSFTVSWVASNVAGVTYVLEYSTDGGSSWTTAYSGTSTSRTVTVPTSGSYIFRVKATKTNYTGSAYATAASLTVNLICGAPASINVPASNTTGSFTVSWVASNVAGVTYVLEYSTDGGSSWTTAYSGTSTSKALSGLASGTYSYRVKATKLNYTDSNYKVSTASCIVTR